MTENYNPVVLACLVADLPHGLIKQTSEVFKTSEACEKPMRMPLAFLFGDASLQSRIGWF